MMTSRTSCSRTACSSSASPPSTRSSPSTAVPWGYGWIDEAQDPGARAAVGQELLGECPPFLVGPEDNRRDLEVPSLTEEAKRPPDPETDRADQQDRQEPGEEQPPPRDHQG